MPILHAPLRICPMPSQILISLMMKTASAPGTSREPSDLWPSTVGITLVVQNSGIKLIKPAKLGDEQESAAGGFQFTQFGMGWACQLPRFVVYTPHISPFFCAGFPTWCACIPLLGCLIPHVFPLLLLFIMARNFYFHQIRG